MLMPSIQKNWDPLKKRIPANALNSCPLLPEEQGQPPMIMMLMMKPVI